MPGQPHHREADGACRGAGLVRPFARELQAVERQRHPGGGVDLVEVADVAEHDAAEPVREPGEEAGDVRTSQPSDEEKCGRARDHVGRNEEGVPVETRRAHGVQDRVPGERLRIRRDRIARVHPLRPQAGRRQEGGDAEVEGIARGDVVAAAEAAEEEGRIEGGVEAKRGGKGAKIPNHGADRIAGV